MRVLLILLASVVVASAQPLLRNPAYLASLRKATSSGAGSGIFTDYPNNYAWWKPETLMTNQIGTDVIGNGTNIIAWGESISGLVLTTNNPTASPPEFNSAGATTKNFGGVEFGSGEYISCAMPAALANTTHFIVWRVNSSGSFIFATDGTNASGRQALFKSSANAFTITSGSDAAGGTATSGQWYVIAWTHNSSGLESLYTNGVAVSTSLDSGNGSLDGIRLGANQSGSLSPGNDSWIGERAIASSIYTATQIGEISTNWMTKWNIP
jgi:hypothetical protein